MPCSLNHIDADSNAPLHMHANGYWNTSIIYAQFNTQNREQKYVKNGWWCIYDSFIRFIVSMCSVGVTYSGEDTLISTVYRRSVLPGVVHLHCCLYLAATLTYDKFSLKWIQSGARHRISRSRFVLLFFFALFVTSKFWFNLSFAAHITVHQGYIYPSSIGNTNLMIRFVFNK